MLIKTIIEAESLLQDKIRCRLTKTGQSADWYNQDQEMIGTHSNRGLAKIEKGNRRGRGHGNAKGDRKSYLESHTVL